MTPETRASMTATTAMTTHTVLGRPTRVLDVGPADGPVLLCSSGIASMVNDWVPLAEMLMSGTRVIAFDRPGYAPGDDVPSDRLDLHEEVSRLLGVLSACGVAKPVTLAGHSFGAAIAEATARLHPEHVSHLVLLDGSVVEPPRPRRESGRRATCRRPRGADDVSSPWLARATRQVALSAARSRLLGVAWRVLGPVTFAVGAPSRLRYVATREGLLRQAGSPTMPAAIVRELMGYSPAMAELLALRSSRPLAHSTGVLAVAANGWRGRTEPTAWVRSVLRQAEALEAEAPVTAVVVPRSGHLVMLDQPGRVAELIAAAVR